MMDCKAPEAAREAYRSELAKIPPWRHRLGGQRMKQPEEIASGIIGLSERVDLVLADRAKIRACIGNAITDARMESELMRDALGKIVEQAEDLTTDKDYVLNSISYIARTALGK